MEKEKFNELLHKFGSEIDNLGLDVIEFTSDYDGYPRGLYNGLAGFDSFEDAEKFAKAHGMQVVRAHRRDGWQLWYSDGRWTEPLNIEDYFEAADHEIDWYDNSDEDRERLLRDLKGMIEGLESIEEIQAVANTAKEVLDQMDEIDDNQKIMVDNGDVSAYDAHPTRVHDDDATEYQIAVTF
jgi:hypothetical protein